MPPILHTEEQTIAVFGPIKFYEIKVEKKIREYNRFIASQTIRCYSREEMLAKCRELDERMADPNSYLWRYAYFTLKRDRNIVTEVRYTVWPVVRAYKKHLSPGRNSGIPKLRPLAFQSVEKSKISGGS